MVPWFHSFMVFDKYLVGGFNPLDKKRQIRQFPQIGVKMKNIWNCRALYHELSCHVSPCPPRLFVVLSGGRSRCLYVSQSFHLSNDSGGREIWWNNWVLGSLNSCEFVALVSKLKNLYTYTFLTCLTLLAVDALPLYHASSVTRLKADGTTLEC